MISRCHVLTLFSPDRSLPAAAEPDFAEHPEHMPLTQGAAVLAGAGAALRRAHAVTIRLPCLSLLADKRAGYSRSHGGASRRHKSPLGRAAVRDGWRAPQMRCRCAGPVASVSRDGRGVRTSPSPPVLPVLLLLPVLPQQVTTSGSCHDERSEHSDCTAQPSHVLCTKPAHRATHPCQLTPGTGTGDGEPHLDPP